ncbi:MAG: MFS transporter [Pseudomonadota bacterium]
MSRLNGGQSGINLVHECKTSERVVAMTGSPRLGRLDEALILLTLALGFMMAMVDVTSVNIALPAIASNFSLPLSRLVWVVDAYTLSFASLLLIGGALAERLGAKTTYQAGLLTFILASLLCGMADSGTLLIIARLLQGLGAALFMPASLSLMSHTFQDQKQRTKMLSIWSALVGVASGSGPLIGGLLVQQFGWRSIFMVNIPLGILGVLMVRKLIPKAPAHPRPLSLLSHALLLAALVSLTFILIEGPTYGWQSALVLSLLAGMFISALALIVQERRGTHPLLPRALFANATFPAASCIGFLISFSTFAQIFLLGIFFQDALHISASQTGLQMLPVMFSFMVGNLLSGQVSARVGTRYPLLFGTAIAGLMALCILVTTLTCDMASALMLQLLTLCVMIMNVSVGLALPAMTATVLQVCGTRYAGSASAAVNASRQIGALVGVAIMGGIFHATADWAWRMPVAFVVLMSSYALACVLTYLFIPRFKQD